VLCVATRATLHLKWKPHLPGGIFWPVDWPGALGAHRRSTAWAEDIRQPMPAHPPGESTGHYAPPPLVD
jgi:hypothetical protein